jgi:uncharacterized protein YggE
VDSNRALSYTPNMIQRIAPVFLLCAGIACAQLTSNSVIVTASRNTALQPDQVVFRVIVETALDATREDAVAALQGSGITLANFTGVNTIQNFNPQGQQTQTRLQWTFSLPVALSNMKSTIGVLSAVQKSNAQKNNGINISFGVAGTQVSLQAQQSQTCSQADLLADARAQAQKLASAAGASLGSVLAMSSATVTSTDTTGGLFSSPSYAPVCSMTVKFALGGF